MLWQAEEDIPPRNEDHIISQVLPLYLRLLHHHNVRFEDVEHRLGSISKVLIMVIAADSRRRSSLDAMASIQTNSYVKSETGRFGDAENHGRNRNLNLDPKY